MHEGDAAGVRRGRLRGRDLRTVRRGVRVPADAEYTEKLARSVFLARITPGQAFSHVTAARMWGIPLPMGFVRSEGVHVSVRAPRTRPRGSGVTGHRLTDPRAGAVMRFGVPVIDAATTWCHLASLLTHDDLVAAADHLVLNPAKQHPGDPRPYLTTEHLQKRVESYHGPGARAARLALVDVRYGSESRPETLLRLMLQRAGLPEPELNVDVFDDDGRWIGRFDQVHRAWKILVEYDGEQHRLDDRQYDRDEVKIEDAIQAGWAVVRIRKGAMRSGGATAIARAERAFRARGWLPGR
ncbi:conserved protein of unknown function [Agreia sp. COWG]|nr:conserved protein of unknown function [Agreia sp. COWG]